MAERAPANVRDATRRDAAFVRLADEHLDRAYRLARAILRDPTEAQDATHDAFVQAWRKWEMLRDPSRFEPWFDRILVNTCRNRLRSTRRQATDISAEVALVTGDHAGHAEDRHVLGAAIEALSPDHQVVIALRFYRDLTVEDIATRLRRARRDGQVPPPLRIEATARLDRCGRHQGDRPMTDRELEERLRAWYAAEVGESERAPAEMRERITAIPASTPMPLRPIARRRNFTLLAVAAVLVVGGGLAAGAGLLRFTVRGAAVAIRPGGRAIRVAASARDAVTDRDTCGRGDLIAFTRLVEKPERTCTSFRRITNCPTLRLWTIDAGGGGAHELQTGVRPADARGLVGRRARASLYQDEDKLYVTDANGSPGQPADTGCVAPVPERFARCVRSRDDGRRDRLRPRARRGRVRLRGGHRHDGPRERRGCRAELDVTGAVEAAPSLVAGRQADRILLVRLEARRRARSQRRSRPSGWSISDGQNLRQVSPTTLAAQNRSMVARRRRGSFSSRRAIRPTDRSWMWASSTRCAPMGRMSAG